MTNNKGVFLRALEKYKKEILEAKEEGDKQKEKDAKWKVKYFKDKIRKRRENAKQNN